MTIVKFILAIVIACALSFSATAQKTLTLDDCIGLALENNIALKRANNNALIAKANRVQAMMNFLPSLQANVNYDYYFGTFFDQNAARQVSATTNSSGPGIQSNLSLFNGFSNHYTVKARDHLSDAAQSTIENQKVQLRSTILGSYLNVVLDKENIKISNQRIELLSAQLEREVKRESVGVGNLEQVYNFKSQLANEKLNLVTAENRLKSDKLQLLQALGLDDLSSYQVAQYNIDESELLINAESYDNVLKSSMDFSPGISLAKSNVLASKYGFKIAKASYLPRISLFGIFGSNYSSNGALNPETGVFENEVGFFDQMGFNKYKYINFSMNIPIFSNWRNRTQVQTAKINLINSELALREAELTVSNTIQAVYLDLVAAQSTYEAAQENLIALNQSYEFVKTRYDNGNTDFFTYLESLNNKNRAEIQLVNAKYSIVFRKKILDIYKGMN